ncbi:MAG TPA: phosphoglucomutase/phosphomannomutase family protein [Saprospiraceae bacterium]|nr:phosphoglucomutase/phosphomannomutase family protein [Saprospiraceae bacterium]
MYTIKFGTDGWRAIVAREYTVDNVRRIAAGTLAWMKDHRFKKAVIGYDCRFGGPMFLEEIAAVLAQDGIECLVADQFVSTPMISLAVVKYQADLGIVITASHNPPAYNGYKLKSSYGGPTIPSDIAEVEARIPDAVPELRNSYAELLQQEAIRVVDLEGDYLSHIRASFDMDRISRMPLAYDAMYGAGQRVMKNLFPELKAFHCEYNPGFNGTPPEPIAKNLAGIMSFLSAHPGQYLGVANDGDADRVAILDDQGMVVDSHHVLLLLIHYLAAYQKQTGAVVVSFSVTNKVKKLADHYGLDCIITKIGFKYIAEYMIQQDVLVAGEESGGLAIKGHIPERDGVWIALTILQFMASTGKSIQELIQEVYQIVGPFAYDRIDLQLTNSQIENVRKTLQSPISHWDSYAVRSSEQVDGYKYYFDEECWLLIRTSGTEPVLRIYAQGRDMVEVESILLAARSVLQV